MSLRTGWPCIRFGGQGIYRAENEDDETTGTADPDPLLFEPRESIAKTVEWMPKVREAVGNAVAIGIEYHHRLSVAEAANLCQKLPPGTLDWLEEPIRDEVRFNPIYIRFKFDLIDAAKAYKHCFRTKLIQG